VVQSLDAKGGGPDDNEAQAGHLIATLRVGTSEAGSGGSGHAIPLTLAGPQADDPLLPLGLDSHRYRCCGNGVVSDVAEWLGVRLRDYFR
jgi:hypothetical protein